MASSSKTGNSIPPNRNQNLKVPRSSRITSSGPMGLDPYCNPAKKHSKTGNPIGYNTAYVYNKDGQLRDTYKVTPSGTGGVNIQWSQYSGNKKTKSDSLPSAKNPVAAQTVIESWVNASPNTDEFKQIIVDRKCDNVRVEGGHF